MKKSSFITFIFDLDGVITETSEYHYKAWKIVCDKIGYNLTRKKNEELKGVNRKQCIELIMQWSNIQLSENEINIYLEEKNNIYNGFIKNLNQNDVCEGVLNFINEALKKNIKIALYSASRNAKKILCQLNIIDLFTVIIDGNNVSNSKPDPEGFKIAADLTKTNTENCVVFEDSFYGIEGANKLNMYTVGIGSKDVLNNANVVYKGFENLKIKDIINV
ncbi:MAG: beta-phosphoglucomutase [Flavobacteriaceae bacterium]|jgi:beta-phosphoglucomutase|nr:beta-phosphoglucomutase [Flavobacteriaceae bacterium]MBT6447431.1 beta-phosphoglucomutase [Flavobacteriaceae bacterium]MBT7623479.1 beta-phosphoglucomutase [Flavobacteriaceae bacterium]